MRNPWRPQLDWRRLAGIGLLILSACDDTTKPPLEPADLASTPRANVEAEEAAVWLSQELVAPEYLYQELLRAFSSLRDQFGNRYPVLRTATFIPPWWVGQLWITLSSKSVNEFRRGEYKDLDHLNERFRLADVDTFGLDYLGALLLIFEGRFHPDRLVEIYSEVPSLRSVEPSVPLGGYSTWLNPIRIRAGFGFLLHLGSGDCVLGCIRTEYVYFRVRHRVEFVGSFVWGEDPLPDWWSEAQTVPQ